MNPAGAQARITFKNILFATDLTFLAEAALPYAMEIARNYRSKIYAVHVRSPIAEWNKPQENAMASLSQRIGDIPHEMVVVEGDPPKALLQQAAEKGADLLVLGTHGRTGLGRLLLGSVAETVFREAPCPVLTVGPRLARDPQWQIKIKEILYATDFSPSAAAAAPYAISLAQENQAELTILNVQPPAKAGELIDAEQYASSTERRLKELVPEDARNWCHPHYVVESGDPAEKILQVAGTRRADLIVLGVRPYEKRNEPKRVIAHRVLAGATCPVLTARG
jgi:nucleotide-binding universal stress UspA family protein